MKNKGSIEKLKLRNSKIIRMINKGEFANCDIYSHKNILLRKFCLLEKLESLEKELAHICRLEIEQYKYFSDLKNVPPY